MGLYRASELWECRRGQDRFSDLLPPPGLPHRLTPPVTTFLRHKPSFTLFKKNNSKTKSRDQNLGPFLPPTSQWTFVKSLCHTAAQLHHQQNSMTNGHLHEDDAKKRPHHHRVQMQGTKPRSWRLNILPEFHSKDSSNTFGFFGFFFSCIYSQAALCM